MDAYSRPADVCSFKVLDYFDWQWVINVVCTVPNVLMLIVDCFFVLFVLTELLS